MKSDILQTHWLALVSINLCMREYQNIAYGSRVMVISVNCQTFGLDVASHNKIDFGNSYQY